MKQIYIRTLLLAANRIRKTRKEFDGAILIWDRTELAAGDLYALARTIKNYLDKYPGDIEALPAYVQKQMPEIKITDESDV